MNKLFQRSINFNCANLIFLIAILIYSFALLFWSLIPLASGFRQCCSDIGVLNNPFYFYPYISFGISEIVRVFGGLWGSILVGRFLLPLFTFALLVAIFRRQLSVLWSIALSLLAVSVIEDYPFRAFILQIISGQWGSAGSGNLPELLYFPIPSFSTPYFLALFFVCTKEWSAPAPLVKISIFTVLFSLIIYINPIDLIFAFAFWVIYLPIRWLRRGMKWRTLAVSLFFQVFLAIIVITPALILGGINLTLPHTFNIDWYYILIYLCLPILLLVILYFVQRIDPYELFFKFRHVYAIMFAEIIFYIAAIFEILPINQDIFKMRILQFFAHTYYYMPVIYFASRVAYINSHGIESGTIARSIRIILRSIFQTYSSFYLIVVITLLFAYNFSSGVSYFEKLHHDSIIINHQIK